jgi:hypothetical protein
MDERYGIGQLRQKTLINKKKSTFCVFTRRIPFMKLARFRLIFEDTQIGGGGGGDSQTVHGHENHVNSEVGLLQHWTIAVHSWDCLYKIVQRQLGTNCLL